MSILFLPAKTDSTPYLPHPLQGRKNKRLDLILLCVYVLTGSHVLCKSGSV